MSMNNTSAYRSPCEILRKINDMFQDESELHQEVRDLLAESELKSKQLSIALHNYEPDFYKRWDKNKDAYNNANLRCKETYKYTKL